MFARGEGKMDRFTKIIIFIFSLISVVAILVLILEDNEKAIALAMIVVISNLSIMMLFLLIFNKLIKVSRGFLMSFIFWIIFLTSIYWYIVSVILHYQFGAFLSLNGVYFFIATRSILQKILISVGSAVIILVLSLFLSYVARKKTDKVVKEEIKALEDKAVRKILKFDKDMVKRKVKTGGIILFFLLFFYLVVLIIPNEHLDGASPVVDMIKVFTVDIEENYTFSNESFVGSQIGREKLLDVKNSNLSVVIIMLESVSRDRMPQYGYGRNVTPNIDKFAQDSIVFNNTFSTSTHSDYAQPSFLSSRYTLTGSYRNFFNLDYRRSFLWDSLKKENYATAYISSQNDNWANMIDYYNIENLDVYSYSLTDGEYDYGAGDAKKDYDEVTANKSKVWLGNASGPLFLYVNLQATHYPYSYPQNNSVFKPDTVSGSTNYFKIAEGDYNNSVNMYDNSLLYVDKQVGLLLDSMKEKGLYNNSIIVLTSDHGETLDVKHGYLRHGFGVYREENLVPMFIKIPGQEHRIINDNVRHIDVLPTILDVLNLSIPAEMQGVPMMKDQEIFVFAQNQNFKIGIIKNNFKYIIDMNDYTLEAYNLTIDPHEENNLEKGEIIVFRGYRDRLLDWYNCQKLYYSEADWGKEILCN